MTYQPEILVWLNKVMDPREHSTFAVLQLHAPNEITKWDREAKRHVPNGEWYCEHENWACHSYSGLNCPPDGVHAPYPCQTVRVIAAQYAAEYAGYKPEWKPEED